MLGHIATTTLTTLALLLPSVSAQSSFPPGVIATGTMGPMNPPQPTLGTAVNQTSGSRLLSINSVDDFCFFAPPEVSDIGSSEAFEVAWCTKARNNARVIPDGVLTGVSFIKTDFYVQVFAYGDFTKLNVRDGDAGGELDPHGATGEGNPVGGNVTTNVVTGSDINIEEWMQFISYNQVCIRACTNANSTYPAASMCEHKLDEMGCNFVMPGNYDFDGKFESCDADVAYPPGWYPVSTVDSTSTVFSTFAQYWTGVVNGVTYTVGDTITPTAPASTPGSSNCVTTSSIANGLNLGASAGTTSGTGSVTTVTTKTTATGASTGTGSATGAASTSPNAATSNIKAPTLEGLFFSGVTSVSVIVGAISVFVLH